MGTVYRHVRRDGQGLPVEREEEQLGPEGEERFSDLKLAVVVFDMVDALVRRAIQWPEAVWGRNLLSVGEKGPVLPHWQGEMAIRGVKWRVPWAYYGEWTDQVEYRMALLDGQGI